MQVVARMTREAGKSGETSFFTRGHPIISSLSVSLGGVAFPRFLRKPYSIGQPRCFDLAREKEIMA
jgi:hypothetical protein